MKLLAVGNSFSQDACTFLHQTAQAQGLDLEVTNLYIGGCPLEKHYQNLIPVMRTISASRTAILTDG